MKEALVYIAAPYTAPDPAWNTREAILVAEQIYEWTNHKLVPLVPHCNLLWNMVAPHDVEHWYEYDLKLLARCDALYRIAGFSPGADREVEFAHAHGIPVFEEDIYDLMTWAAERSEAQM